MLTLAFCTVMWVAGWLVSRHTRRAEVMALRAKPQSRRRSLRCAKNVQRIARELHDVVSHGLSVVVLQTVAARSALEADLTPRSAGTSTRWSPPLEKPSPRCAGCSACYRWTISPSRNPRLRALGLRNLPTLIDGARAAGLDVDDSGIDNTGALPADWS